MIQSFIDSLPGFLQVGRIPVKYVVIVITFCMHNRPISRVVIGRGVDYRSRLIYVRYCLTNTTLCL